MTARRGKTTNSGLRRVLVADDHAVLRAGLRMLLSTQPDIELVGEATTADEAVTLARSLRPDIVILDLSMPGLDGIETLRRLRRQLAEARGVPPYVVFSDRTLQEMATRFPDTPETLRTIAGVGDVKLAQYGAEFVTAVQGFLAAHPEAKPQAPLAITRMPKPPEVRRLMLPTRPSLTSTRSDSSLMMRMSA